MKKSIITALCVLLCATMAITGTVAYLTDEDDAVNTFGVGNVNIVQHEKERDADDFEQDQTIFPIVQVEDGETKDETVPVNWNGDITLVNTGRYNNYIDKIVTVENKGKSEAYVRSIVAVPTGLPEGVDAPWLEVDFLDAATGDNDDWTKLAKVVEDVEIDGILYDLHVFNYVGPTDGKLQPNDLTLPTLLGFNLHKHVNFDEDTNDGAGAYFYQEPGKYPVYLTLKPEANQILVATQAVQVEGFGSFTHAFKESFGGDITPTNHPWYKAPVEPAAGYVGTTAYTWQQLVDAKLVTVDADGKLTYIDPSITELTISSKNVKRTTKIEFKDDNNVKHQLSTLTIGDGVAIGSNSFLNWESLNSLTLGKVEFVDASGSTSINQFCGCSNIRELILSEGITVIPNGCFASILCLTNVVVPASVTEIGNNAFMNCRALTTITLPSSFNGKMNDAEKTRIFYEKIPSNIQYHS